jgi:hypothetical protein
MDVQRAVERKVYTKHNFKQTVRTPRGRICEDGEVEDKRRAKKLRIRIRS